jgi:hypothetical protein
MSFTVGTVSYAQKTAQPFVQNFVDPAKSHKPLERTQVKISDARPLLADLRLDAQGFMLMKHDSKYAHLGSEEAMGEAYVNEMAGVVADIVGDADFVLPCGELMMRFSVNAPMHQRETIGRVAGIKPTSDVHMDFSAKSFQMVVQQSLQHAGKEQRDYRHIVVIQTWRALSDPPQDFSLALTDARTVQPGRHVLMTNIVDAAGSTGETRLGLRDDNHAWYYFPRMRQDELIVFKGYDSALKDAFNVYHAAFDNTAAEPNFIPRSSVEMRYVAFWK